MAVIQKNIRLIGSVGQRDELALFDCGATYSCIAPCLARQIEVVLPLPRPKVFGTAKDSGQLTAKERVSLDFEIGDYRFSDEFMLISELSEPVIIGAATLQKWRMKLDFSARGGSASG
jgi:hypothetical protein